MVFLHTHDGLVETHVSVYGSDVCNLRARTYFPFCGWPARRQPVGLLWRRSELNVLTQMLATMFIYLKSLV